MWWRPTRRYILLALAGLRVGTLNIYFTRQAMELLALPGTKMGERFSEGLHYREKGLSFAKS